MASSSYVVSATFLRQVCTLHFTAASQSPLKCGDFSGMYFHLILCEAQNSTIVSELLLMKACSRPSSRSAPMKLLPWSLMVTDGRPRHAMKCLRQAMNAVVRSVTNSKCTAFTAKHTNTQMYTLTMVGFLVLPNFMRRGPAKSTPICWKTAPGVTLSWGSCPHYLT